MSNKKYKLVKCIGAFALAGIMATSFVGCNSSYKPEENTNDNQVVNSVDGEGNHLSILILKDKNSFYPNEYEFYGYFEKFFNDSICFRDVLNNKVYNLSHENYFNKYEFYYVDMYDYINLYESDKKKIDYTINEYTLIEDLKKYERKTSATIVGFEETIGLTNRGTICKAKLFDAEAYFKDSEDYLKQQESTTLTKNK